MRGFRLRLMFSIVTRAKKVPGRSLRRPSANAARPISLDASEKKIPGTQGKEQATSFRQELARAIASRFFAVSRLLGKRRVFINMDDITSRPERQF